MAFRGKTDDEWIAHVTGLATTLRRAYASLHKEWTTDLGYYYGKPQSGKSGEGEDVPVFNQVFASVETHTSHQLSSVPEIFVRAVTPDFDKAAKDASDIMHSAQFRAGLQAKYQRICRRASQIGTAFLLVRWEQPIHRPGMVQLDILDPFSVYVDSNATDIEDAEFVMVERYLTLPEARRLFPLMKNVIPDLPRAEVEETSFAKAIRKMSIQPGADTDDMPSQEKIHYLQAWTNRGQVVVKILGKRLVKEQVGEETRESPYENPDFHGTFPIVPFYATQDADGFWGIGDIRNIRDPQDELNKRRQQIIDVLDHMRVIQSKILVSSRDRKLNTDALKTTEFEVLHVENINENMPRTIQSNALEHLGIAMNAAQMFDYDIDKITGLYDPAKGESAKRVYSGRQTALLQGASAIRFQTRLDSTLTSFRRLGNLMLSLLQQYQTLGINERVFYESTIGGGRYIRTHDEDHKPILPELEEKGDDDVSRPLPFLPGFDPRFEIIVQPTDEAPMAGQARGQLLLSLMQSGSADTEAVVRALRLPNGDAMLERIGKKAIAGLPPIGYYPDEVVEALYQIAWRDIQARLGAGDRQGALAELGQGQEQQGSPEESAQMQTLTQELQNFQENFEEQAQLQQQAEYEGRPMGEPT